MECALLEGQQSGLLSITPGTLGEHPHALASALHLIRSALHRASRALGVPAINEDRSRQGHKPAKDRNTLQAGLGSHGAVGREDGAEHEDIELSLVGTDEDSGANGVQVVFGVLNDNVYAGAVFHHELKGPSGGILGRVVEPERPREERDYDAV